MKTSIAEMLKVLIIVENLPVPFDRRVWEEAKTLRKAGHQVSVICPVGGSYTKHYEEIEGIHVYRHPLPLEGKGCLGYLLEYAFALFWEFFLSLKVWWERGFDVIQACNPPDTIFLIAFFYKVMFRKKFIFDHHDINPELYLAKFGRKDFFYNLLLVFERLTFMAADRSIATNESYKKIAIQRGKMPADKVSVVRSSPNLNRVKRVPPNPSWKRGRRFSVGYVGVMGEQEGIDHLLEAARILIYEMKREDIQFVLVGGGTQLESMRDLSRTLGLDEYVTFTGRVPDEILFEALCTADLCVNPDVANEMNDKSTMNKIMEYMALGKPIVQYDLTEGRISAQKASLYAEKNNRKDMAGKIAYLLDRPELRREMGEFGRKRVVERLHWEVEAPKYLKVYKGLFLPSPQRVFAPSAGKRPAVYQTE